MYLVSMLNIHEDNEHFVKIIKNAVSDWQLSFKRWREKSN